MSYISRRPQAKRPHQDFLDDWYDTGGPDQITVHEDSQEPTWTGLYDAQGNDLCRIADKLPMGFRLK